MADKPAPGVIPLPSDREIADRAQHLHSRYRADAIAAHDKTSAYTSGMLPLCKEHGLNLCDLAAIVQRRFPKLWPQLPLLQLVEAARVRGHVARFDEIGEFDWFALESELRLVEKVALDAVVKQKPAKRRRRAVKLRKPREPTPRQLEVIQIFGECNGNLAAVARKLGRDRKTIEETYKAGMMKLGKTVYHSKDKTRLLARDRRGQEVVSDDDDRRL